MRIACPSCAAEYEVPDRLLAGAARRLRCARCAAEFALPGTGAAPSPAPLPAAPPAAAPPEAAPRPEPPPADPPSSPRVPLAATHAAPEPGSDVALRRAWAASVALVLGAAASLLLFRGAVMEAWPPAIRLFAALGLG
ncbi:zinc-ribbon domain-containing protein [Roseomonas sp. HF4]|uniref:zinc-ribbon domain-containing protein n=1 Tax=Roseomonas sp. HF4 TaxID=2562313 RepID=UPI001485C20B|nr:zinc-ribbon domain-containing protein [Roseomonas sp. HF4]